MARILEAFITAISITAITTCLIIRHDPYVKEWVQYAACQQMSAHGACSFFASIQEIDIFKGTLILEQIHAQSRAHDKWSWSAESISLVFSWLDFLREKKINFSLYCSDMQVYSQVTDGKLAIAEHLAAFLQEKETPPVMPEHFHINRARVTIESGPQMRITTTIKATVDTFADIQKIQVNFQHPYADLVLKGAQNSFSLAGTVQVPGYAFPVKVAGAYADNGWHITGTTPEYALRVYGNRAHMDQLHSVVTYQDQEYPFEITLSQDGTFVLNGDIPTATPVIPFTVRGSSSDGKFQARVEVADILQRIPYTYNFVRAFAATVEPHAGYILLKDAQIKTDQGSIKSGIITVGLDNNNTLCFLHAPLHIEDLFINHSKAFLAQLSGALTLTYERDSSSSIVGVCTLKRCHIRDNPFAATVGTSLKTAALSPLTTQSLVQTTNLDILVTSREPLVIKTDVVQAKAHLRAEIKGTIGNPQLFGHIELQEGKIQFPYKALDITSGKIYFVDNERDDPPLEVTASALIKNYHVTLSIDGTALQPRITLSSSPHLQEEQIVGLLFGGTPDNSVSLVMPVSSVGALEKVLFDTHDTSSTHDTVKRWFEPLENVKIVPRFCDQTSRGGVRGALAIEVNDNLSALIQQNFSLSEDVLIEVAYKPTDEITLRGVRDERGDFGGEIEARFTW